jgi:Xaa-Pro aminopeptidase
MSTTDPTPVTISNDTLLPQRVHLIVERLTKLRFFLLDNKLDACLIPTSDPHQSEYLAKYWKFREYISGFTGSFGTLVVTGDTAGLWTDSRYFLQAETELAGTGILLYKLGVPGTPSPETWIINNRCKHVGLDGSLYTTDEVLRLKQRLGEASISLHTDFDPYIKVWTDRPLFPQEPAWMFPHAVSGESTSSKLNRVRKAIREAGADALPLTMLDDIAWLLNIRGSDIECNPVIMAFAFIDLNRCILFTEPSKIGPDASLELQNANIELAPYNSFLSFMAGLKDCCILVDYSRLNHLLHEQVKNSCTLIQGLSPIRTFKAIKNPVEMDGFRLAMQKDGIAWIRLLMWLERPLSPLSECEVGEKIAMLRRSDEAYMGESFAPIAAFSDHGAIVHYEADLKSAYSIQGEGALLMDFGAHYLHGTTDTTRTIYLNGQPSDTFKTDYTCLLKGLIDLSMAIFPEGTRGTQLDILARQHLWNRQLNYLHGTGHGIGHCLFVHEGPQNIRMNENPVCLEPGMVISNEPGLYRAGEYGIRLENVIHVIETSTTESGRYFAFETLTLVPFDLDCIDWNLLEQRHMDWLNEYHRRVYEVLSTQLHPEECNWLREKTRTIKNHTFNNSNSWL